MLGLCNPEDHLSIRQGKVIEFSLYGDALVNSDCLTDILNVVTVAVIHTR